MTQKKVTKEATDLILLSENSELATKHIETLKLRAAETTALIKFFNDINLLNPITYREQAMAFLKDPVAYLDTRILNDCEVAAKVQLLPAKIAELVGLDYARIAEKIGACKLRNLENMVFDEEAQTIEFDKKCTKEVMESFYEYAKDKQESDAVTEARGVCQVLNDYCKNHEIPGGDMNLVADRLHLKCVLIPGSRQNDPGSHCMFIENIISIRDKLAYKKLHGL